MKAAFLYHQTLSAVTISVTPDGTRVIMTWKTLCGMARVVPATARAAHSMILHGSALPEATSDDIEVRICNRNDWGAEDTPIAILELYIK